MDTKKTKEELDALLEAATQIFEKGYSDIKCPRCGNNLIYEEYGTSYTIKCNTPECIKTDFRGI